MQNSTMFDVIAAENGWIVRCHSAIYGRFRTQSEAFNAAVAEARKIKEAGRMVQVRVLRDEVFEPDRYLSLL